MYVYVVCNGNGATYPKSPVPEQAPAAGRSPIYTYILGSSGGLGGDNVWMYASRSSLHMIASMSSSSTEQG